MRYVFPCIVIFYLVYDSSACKEVYLYQLQPTHHHHQQQRKRKQLLDQKRRFSGSLMRSWMNLFYPRGCE